MSIPVFTDPPTGADPRALAAHVARLQRQLAWALSNLEAENLSPALRKQLK